MTHREFLTWEEWLRQEWDQPSRTDHYLMRIAMEVACVLAKNPKKITMDQFKIPFDKPSSKGRDIASLEPKIKMTKEQAAYVAKRMWAGRLGVPLEKLNIIPKDVTMLRKE